MSCPDGLCPPFSIVDRLELSLYDWRGDRLELDVEQGGVRFRAYDVSRLCCWAPPCGHRLPREPEGTTLSGSSLHGGKNTQSNPWAVAMASLEPCRCLSVEVLHSFVYSPLFDWSFSVAEC